MANLRKKNGSERVKKNQRMLSNDKRKVEKVKTRDDPLSSLEHIKSDHNEIFILRKGNQQLSILCLRIIFINQLRGRYYFFKNESRHKETLH